MKQHRDDELRRLLEVERERSRRAIRRSSAALGQTLRAPPPVTSRGYAPRAHPLRSLSAAAVVGGLLAFSFPRVRPSPRRVLRAAVRVASLGLRLLPGLLPLGLRASRGGYHRPGMGTNDQPLLPFPPGRHDGNG